MFGNLFSFCSSSDRGKKKQKVKSMLEVAIQCSCVVLSGGKALLDTDHDFSLIYCQIFVVTHAVNILI